MGTARRAKHGARVTLWDVAGHAGVSKSTVSKYLTATPYVAASTAQRIQAAIDELGYEPNGLGRGLAQGRTGLVAVVVPSVLNPFYTELVSSIDDECTANNVMVMLGSTQHDPEKQILRRLLQKGVDGFLIASAEVDDEQILALEKQQVPFVLASRHFEGTSGDYVIVDGYEGARQAVSHLYELGHRRIAHLAGPPTVAQFRDRANGYREAMRQHGVQEHVEVVELADSTWECGKAVVADLLARPEPQRPTAVFVANDYAALGVVAGARQAGAPVPQQLSVVGFDNISFAAEAQTPLTTVDSHIEELGRWATRMLLDRVQAQFDPASAAHHGPVREVLSPQLVVRESAVSPSPGDQKEATS